MDSVTITLTREELDALDWLTYYGIDELNKATDRAVQGSNDSGMAGAFANTMLARQSQARNLRYKVHGMAIREGL